MVRHWTTNMGKAVLFTEAPELLLYCCYRVRTRSGDTVDAVSIPARSVTRTVAMGRIRPPHLSLMSPPAPHESGQMPLVDPERVSRSYRPLGRPRPPAQPV